MGYNYEYKLRKGESVERAVKKFSRKCKKLGINKLGYDCKQLEIQEIEESEPWASEDKAHYYTTGEVKYFKKPWN